MDHPTEEPWSVVHDLALVCIALAHSTDHRLTDDELASIVDVLAPWSAGAPAEARQEAVVEAMAVYLEPEAEQEVVRAIEALRTTLSAEERQRALEAVVRVAEADGIVLSSEQSLIATLAQAWELKCAADLLLRKTTVVVEAKPGAWSLLHDVALLYLVVAHSTDNALHEAEIAAIVTRLGEWDPALEEADVREVTRQALAFYAEEPGASALQGSVAALREALPVVQRLTLLDDLVYIARADGAVTDREEAMIASLAKAWGLGGVRLAPSEP